METSNLPAHSSQHILHSLIELIMQYSYWHSRRMAEVVEMCVCVSVCVSMVHHMYMHVLHKYFVYVFPTQSSVV